MKTNLETNITKFIKYGTEITITPNCFYQRMWKLK